MRCLSYAEALRQKSASGRLYTVFHVFRSREPDLPAASGRKGMEAGAVGERFEKLIDKSHKKRYILFINALKKSVHRLGPHREPGAAENPAGYRRGTVTLEQER